MLFDEGFDGRRRKGEEKVNFEVRSRGSTFQGGSAPAGVQDSGFRGQLGSTGPASERRET